jgi:hypothetical protein
VRFLQSGEQSTVPVCLESLGTASVLFWQHHFATRRPDSEITIISKKETKIIYTIEEQPYK